MERKSSSASGPWKRAFATHPPSPPEFMPDPTPSADSERSRLVRALREQQEQLKEILDALERRDLTPSQIREHLGWVAEGLRELRKDARRSAVRPPELS